MVEVRRSKEEEEEEDKNVSQQPGDSHTAALYTIEQAGVASCMDIIKSYAVSKRHAQCIRYRPQKHTIIIELRTRATKLYEALISMLEVTVLYRQLALYSHLYLIRSLSPSCPIEITFPHAAKKLARRTSHAQSMRVHSARDV